MVTNCNNNKTFKVNISYDSGLNEQSCPSHIVTKKKHIKHVIPKNKINIPQIDINA